MVGWDFPSRSLFTTKLKMGPWKTSVIGPDNPGYADETKGQI
jgi:hypothetical protein